MDTRSRKNDKKEVKDSKRNKKNVDKLHELNENIDNASNNFTILIESRLKGIIDNFIKKEINNEFKNCISQSTNNKEKSGYAFNLMINDEINCNKIIEKFLNYEEFKEKNEIKIFKNHELITSLNQLNPEDIKNTNVEVEEKIMDNVQNKNKIHDSHFDVILLENVSLNQDKIYEIFFIYGDILEILLKKEEKKCYLRFKYDSSTDKALKKLTAPESHKSFTIKKISSEEIPEIINLFKIKPKDGKESKIIFINFLNDTIKNINESDDLIKQVKKYGEVERIFRKMEGKSYYIQFKENHSSLELIKDFDKGLFSLKNIDNADLIIDYAFKKSKKENLSNKVQKKEPEQQKDVLVEENVMKEKLDEKVQFLEKNTDSVIDQNAEIKEKSNEIVNQIEPLDINKYWQTYYDQNFNRNYYYNPFLNESVWDLPEGAEVLETQIQNEQNVINVNSSDNFNQAELEIPDNLSQSYYDDEAWEEDELREKIIWDKMKQEQLKEWLKRPARQQVADTRRDTAYIEGNYDYNIWYDKYLTDRKEEKEKIPAMHKCNPALDTGFTKADLQEREGGAYFCLYFAKGCCSEGVNCRYYHRVPTKPDAEKIENLRDVFGRSRFATHRNDMGGVGTFTRDCRTLYVSDLKMIDTSNPIKEMIRIIYENFSPWGEIEDINYIPTKAACFIRFSHRCFAEFAKEAMMDQSLVGEEILGVKWAFDDPNPNIKKKHEKEHENRFLNSFLKRQENKNNLLNKKRNNPNSDYHSYYNNRNNPYATGQNYGYESGYGVDESSLGNFSQTQQITNNCVKLSETLKMIDENFKNTHNFN